MGMFNEDLSNVNKLTVAYIITLLGNLLFIIIASFIWQSTVKSMLLSGVITISTIAITYAKSKFGMYEDGKNKDMMYTVYIMQIIITFIVVLFGLSLLR